MTIHRIALAIAAAAAIAVSGCSLERPMDTRKAERAIKPELQRQLRANMSDDSITVESVDCEPPENGKAKCVAEVSDSTGASLKLKISGDYDPKTGRLLWRLD